jgi:tyrosine decarboxylase/aspartate 1-decarboxylase
VTLHSQYVPEEIAKKYDLVPEQHNDNNKWYKIVLMDHVEVQHLTAFINELKATIHA